jgi:hypothetical protein
VVYRAAQLVVLLPQVGLDEFGHPSELKQCRGSDELTE